MPDNEVILWDLESDRAEPIAELRGHDRDVTSLAFSPTGDMLASGSDDDHIRLWSVPTGDELGVLDGHTDLVQTLTFSPDGSLLASGGEDFTLRVWDVARRVQLGQPWQWRDATVTALAIGRRWPHADGGPGERRSCAGRSAPTVGARRPALSPDASCPPRSGPSWRRTTDRPTSAHTIPTTSRLHRSGLWTGPTLWNARR